MNSVLLCFHLEEIKIKIKTVIENLCRCFFHYLKDANINLIKEMFRIIIYYSLLFSCYIFIWYHLFTFIQIRTGTHNTTSPFHYYKLNW